MFILAAIAAIARDDVQPEKPYIRKHTPMKKKKWDKKIKIKRKREKRSGRTQRRTRKKKRENTISVQGREKKYIYNKKLRGSGVCVCLGGGTVDGGQQQQQQTLCTPSTPPPKLVRCFHFPLLPLPLPPYPRPSFIQYSLSHPATVSHTHSPRIAIAPPRRRRRDDAHPVPFLRHEYFFPFFFLFVLHVSHVCVCAPTADDFFPLLSFPASFVVYGFPERETFSIHINIRTGDRAHTHTDAIICTRGSLRR